MKIRLVVPFVVLMVLLAGCSGGGGTGGSTDAPDAPPPGMRGVQNALIGVACSKGGLSGPWTFVAAATDPTSGAVVRELRFTLPLGTEPAFPCADARGRVASAGIVPSFAFRQVFDRDYTRVAVTARTGRSGASRVGVYDISTGRVTDLSASQSDFAALPQDHSAVFADDDRVWFASDNTRTVVSVAPDGRERRDEGPAGYTNGVTMLGSGDIGLAVAPRTHTVVPLGAGGKAYVVPSPDGTRLASVDQAPLTGRSGPLELRSSPNGRGSSVPVAGTLGRVEQWADDSTLLGIAGSGRGTAVTVATIAPGGRAATARALTPVTDRYNASPVASPDGSAVAFLSFRAQEAALYRVAITGGEPAVVAPRTTASNFLLEWR